MGRSEFHQQHAERATAEARRLLEQRQALGARWLGWVATELYHLKPPEFAAMVRRELARLNEG
ncbi:MAG: hypothetical protein KKD27_17040 [Gammaproteobacteria bacterium]|jgi:hypothetical protein|uniref:hypothetical protein n=1 Tax=Stutzerimonas xanthomarina TaxID=271420 RepID=UPI000C3825CD|nr:hypothetical protein [Stutzerimonas xanthomarina]MBK59373.1 hypothetical protein [Pseudomonas sp.]MBU0812242.1 hypothetical protein [Gammaproteobacteria bacterium]MBK3847024.1 hypothetical protein [Stutzerimonas xanthomarina]MBU0854554.1 hypothetical protein [Gammaproteobacteria bacterium]MBU1303720.1 hypothetical protein [Gammaproteobacteria bacterium]|tara:strand:- start:655 stop:843 length:189 start_codon:yes stop_codon:yes gene_type:complete